MTETLSHPANHKESQEQPSDEQLMAEREAFISSNEAWSGRVALESLTAVINYNIPRKDSSVEFTD